MAKKKPTQEEIIQEIGEVSSNWDKGDKPAMQDPIVWREDYKTEDIINGWDPKLIKNGSMNKDAYGDDGNGVNNVDIPEMYGGKNDKYMGEGTRNTFEAYNPNLTTAGLDPNYKYGVDARMANSAEANYIARRNDMIASALYNEGRTSMQDVADFLNSQEGFRNSTEGERQNTIASIWKRIGEKGQGEEAPKEETDLSKADSILEDTSGKLYGKTTADSGKPVEGIDTLSDANSVFKSMQEDRVQNLKEFVSLDPHVVAVSLLSNSGAISEQTLRDAQMYYPEFMSQVNAEKKKIIVQENATAIAKGGEITTTADKVDTNTELTSYAVNNATQTTSATQLLQSIDSILESNDTAKSAQELMGSIENDMAKLKNRLRNLRAEVSADFKGDAPDYLVNAAMNNKSQEIQNQLSILEDRYNAAYNRYKTELGNAQWEAEFSLKEEQLELDKQQAKFDKWYKEQTMNKSNIYTDKDGVPWELKEGEDGVLYYEKINQITQYEGSGMKGKGYKNNNPGNIKDNDFGNVIGHDGSGFAIFATPEDGFDALVEKIKFNQTNPNSRYYGTTIREYFKIYAPSSDGNNPDAYAKSVAQQLGVGVDTPISKLDPVKLAAVIAKHDSGYDYSTYGQFRGGKSSKGKTINVDDIEIPDSVYNNGYMSVDPNSELGKQLRQDYIDNYLKENGLTAGTENSNVPMTTVTLDSGESYQIPTSYYRYIYGPIPSRQKDSDLDNQRILEQILDLYNNGLSVTDALLTFNGINLNSDYADKARALFGHVMASGKDPAEGLNSSIAYNLTEGNDGLAVAAVENFVLPDEQKKEIVRITALAEKISDFIELTNSSEYSKYFGPYDSPVNTWLGKKVGNEKATKAYADLGNIYADIRQQLMGSAVTEHEAEIYDPILAESDENLNTIIQKLKSTLQGQMAMYNAIRGQYGLPRLDMYSDDFMNQVLYPDSRVGLYMDNNY